MKILIVEDDPSQAAWIRSNLESEFRGAEIERIGTEFEFQSKIDLIAEMRPDVILMDVMLRWTDPSPRMPPPPEEVQREKFFRAGLRCRRLLAERTTTRTIPMILYTVLERNDIKQEIGEEVRHLPKEADPKPLFDLIRRVTAR